MTTDDGTPAGGETPGFPANAVEESLNRALARSQQEAADTGTPAATGAETGTDAEADTEWDADTAAVAAFIAALRDGDLWVPLPAGSGVQDDGSVALPTLELEGSQFIPVFTSEEQLSVRSGHLPFTIIATRELAGLLPEGVGLALNPGNEASVPIYADTVAALAGT